MLWQFIPLVPQVIVFILTIMCIIAGQPKYGTLSDFHILSVDATGLKAINGTEPSKQLPIHDYYRLYLTTQCASNVDKILNFYFDVICSKPSNNANFDLRDLVSRDLENSHENFTKLDLAALFPKDLQLDFELHNQRFHVTYCFYILTAVWAGILIVIGLFTFLPSPFGEWFARIAALFAGALDTWIFIASVIVTVVAYEAARSIERNSDYLTVSVGGNFLALTWSAFGIMAVLGTVSYIMACIVGLVEKELRSNDD